LHFASDYLSWSASATKQRLARNPYSKAHPAQSATRHCHSWAFKPFWSGDSLFRAVLVWIHNFQVKKSFHHAHLVTAVTDSYTSALLMFGYSASSIF
jgi:hypothetical protein